MSTFLFTDPDGLVDEVQTTAGTLEALRRDVAHMGRHVYAVPPRLMDAQAHSLPGNARVRDGHLEVFSLRAIRERLAACEMESLEVDEFQAAGTLQTIEWIKEHRNGELTPMLREHYKANMDEFHAIEGRRQQLLATAPEAPEMLAKLAGRRFRLEG